MDQGLKELEARTSQRTQASQSQLKVSAFKSITPVTTFAFDTHIPIQQARQRQAYHGEQPRNHEHDNCTKTTLSENRHIPTLKKINRTVRARSLTDAKHSTDKREAPVMKLPARPPTRSIENLKQEAR